MELKYVAMAVAALSASAVVTAGYGSLRAINKSIALQDASQSTTEFVSLVKDFETSSRGFVITGDESFLQPWNEANRVYGEAQSKLSFESLQLDADSQSPLGLLNLARTKFEWSRDLIETSKRSPAEAAAMVKSGDGKDVMDELRTSASQFVATLDQKTDAQWRLISHRYLPLGSVGLAGLIISIAGLLYVIIRESRATAVARNLMQTVMAGAPVGLALTADGARINSANRAFLELFAGQGERLREIPLHIQAAMKARQEATASGEATTHDLTLERDGASRFIRLTTFPVTIDSENGRVRDGTGIAAVDLTEEKMLEQHLAAARDEAEAANQAKSTFLANMSHELRTPLTAIIGYCELLQEETAEAGNVEVQADLDKINGNARHLLALINDVLDLSKIEAQKMDIHAVPFSLHTFLKDLDDAVGALIEKNSNTFTVTNKAGDVTLHTDDLKLKQILLNLIGNAAKFTSSGSINLDVSSSNGSAGDALNFEVTDTGIGMSDDQMKNLFTRFNQADTTTTRRFGGTGLGLALTKALASMLGGTISVQSKEGVGSTFTVTVPSSYVALSERFSDVDPMVKDTSTPGTGRLVLIADDQRASREILERHLARSGFRTVSVTTGTEVLTAINKERPAAVLLDVMMPGLDGWHVLRSLRDNPDTRDIPVIMQTVLDERHFAYTLGADGYLKKPVQRDELLTAIADTVREENPRVLLVENEVQSASVIAQQFEATPWHVTRTASAEEAMAEIKSRTGPPHVILVSASLPDDTGFNLVKRLRGLPELVDTRIYLLTTSRKAGSDMSMHVEGASTVAKTEEAIRNLVDELRHLTENTERKGITHGTHSAG
jgi:signal transduction histidine kinase/DNA-binding response OmpR family regulator